MLCNQSSRFYCDSQDVDGVIKLLLDEEEARGTDFECALCEGASITFKILQGHQLKTPSDFMTVFRLMAFGEHTSNKKIPSERD